MAGKAGKNIGKITIRGGNRLEIDIIFTYFWLDFNSYKSGHPDIYQILKTIWRTISSCEPICIVWVCVCSYVNLRPESLPQSHQIPLKYPSKLLWKALEICVEKLVATLYRHDDNSHQVPS